MNGERIYRGAVRGFSAALAAIGLAVLVATLAAGGGPASIGFLLGIAFLGVGAARLWLSARTGR